MLSLYTGVIRHGLSMSRDVELDLGNVGLPFKIDCFSKGGLAHFAATTPKAENANAGLKVCTVMRKQNGDNKPELFAVLQATRDIKKNDEVLWHDPNCGSEDVITSTTQIPDCNKRARTSSRELDFFDTSDDTPVVAAAVGDDDVWDAPLAVWKGKGKGKAVSSSTSTCAAVDSPGGQRQQGGGQLKRGTRRGRKRRVITDSEEDEESLENERQVVRLKRSPVESGV